MDGHELKIKRYKMNCLKSRYNTKRWRRKKQHNVVLIKKKNETKQNDANAKDLAIKVKQYRRQKKKKKTFQGF